ncbi:hypothetical protein [Ottowia testudinis]|uniref:Uncharacterized protein n=1 Tax=Ottowia testudinis TaxID=2816950 RepID=A0A975CDU5_9BURK|nr:hypothetical protein [Ottowia testudinis]QTD44570.1 hypothetical protein J1M35_15940 [Ottowia testudinis]
MKLVALSKSSDALRYARELLARCETGEVVAVTAIEERPGGTYQLAGSKTSSRTQTAGMLLDAAITRLADE